MVIIFLGSCHSSKEKDFLEIALKMAGDNRKELEKVLTFYSRNLSDSLKYKAACFLIENMPYYYSFEGPALDTYLTFYKTLAERKDVPPDVLLKEHTEKYGQISISQLQIKYDIQEIDSAYLCNNIEWSFKVWEEQPWGKHVSFDDFCEYILPYRIGNEKLTYWKEDLYNKYITLIEQSIKTENLDDPATAATKFIAKISKDNYRFTTYVPQVVINIGPYYTQYMSGTCQELSDFMAYACRSVGIPCHINFLPVTGRWQYGNQHFFTSYSDKNGEIYFQEFLNNPTRLRYDPFRSVYKTKVYRKTFSVNHKLEDEMKSIEPTVHPFFKTPKFKDVTVFYSDCYKESITIPTSKLLNKLDKKKIYYLYMARWQGWVPVTWGKVENGELKFHDIQKGDVVMLATYDGEKMIPQTYPFHIHCPLANLHFFGPDTSNYINARIYSKAPLEADLAFLDRMPGGVFEGSNDPNFINKDTVYMIKDKPYRLLTNVLTNSEKKYRYIRYFGPPWSGCNVSEIGFYEN